jgi:uncharacterized membrane protein YeaQ/YmgE (transglycosylase-associated protein family)
MTLGGFIVLLIIAAICGGLGQAIGGFSRGGCLFSILLGFVGAYLGLYVAGRFGLPEFFPVNIQGESFPIVWSIIGAAILSFIVSLLFRAGRR